MSKEKKSDKSPETEQNYVKKKDRNGSRELEAQNEKMEKPSENEESEHVTDNSKILEITQKALNQLISIVNNHTLGTSQRQEILKILPVFIEQKHIFAQSDLLNELARPLERQRQQQLLEQAVQQNFQQSEKHKHHSDDKSSKKSNIKSEIDELIGTYDHQQLLAALSQKSNKMTSNKDSKSELNIEQHEEKIHQLDCALGIEKITSNMGKFEEMNKKFNAILEKQMPGQKKEFLKFFKKNSLASAFKHNKDFQDDDK